MWRQDVGEDPSALCKLRAAVTAKIRNQLRRRCGSIIPRFPKLPIETPLSK